MTKKLDSETGSSAGSSFTQIDLPDAGLIDRAANNYDLAKYPIVGIGASAGGVEALQKLLKYLPSTCNVSYIIVTHLSPTHPSRMADILAREASMPVMQATDGMKLEINTLYVIPPNYYLTLDKGFLQLEQMTQPRTLPKTIDRLFISLAEELQEKSICIVLTGGDHDGTVGLKAIKAAGGIALAQLPETALHPEMPESAIITGLVDYVLPVEKMGSKLEQYIEQSCLWQTEPLEITSQKETQALKNLIVFLSKHGSGDFRGYKEGMLMRRTKRRMALQGITGLDNYLAYLRKNPPEIQNLSADFLIKVTEFFREPRAWKALEQNLLPKIIETLDTDATLRIWIAGCATGEEAYSMGIAALELINKGNLSINLNIIASDLDPSSLEFARDGCYPASIGVVLKPDLLTRYFTILKDGRFLVRKALREHIMFTQHNLLADPPFSKLDLISCRNLLIYLNPDVQKELFSLFHFSLKPGGYLFLGKSETVEQNNELFLSIDKSHRFYRAVATQKKAPIKLPLVPEAIRTQRPDIPWNTKPPSVTTHAELVRELLLKQRSATAVLIDDDSQVLYFYGPTHEFLWQREGALTRDLLAMVSDDMRIALRAVIHSAHKEEKAGEIILPAAENNRQLRIRAIPAGEQSEGLLLITFEYESLSSEPSQAVNDLEQWTKRQLEDDLRTTRLDLQASIEALEASNVELRVANEEAMSLNEELQSANEELETSREELQSMNEELTTVNADMERMMNELRATNDDLASLLSNSDIPTLFLDRELRIKRFTFAAHKLINLIPSDLGRSIKDFSLQLEPQDLIPIAQHVQESGLIAETEVLTPDDHYYFRRILPYRTKEDRIEGVVITFIPIDTLKKAEHKDPENKKDESSR